MKKVKLPKNWVVVDSKSHPERVYYFNVKTNESSWEQPMTGETNKPSTSNVLKSKERIKCDGENSIKLRAKTPDLDESKSIDVTIRPKLIAKRRSKLTKERDTPAMAEIRKKMLQRKTKNGSSKSVQSSNSKSSKLFSSQGTIAIQRTAKEKINGSIMESNKNEKDNNLGVMTPQMKIIYEKLQQKNTKKTVPKQCEPSGSIEDTTLSDTGISTKKKSQSRNLRCRSRINNTIEDNDIKSSLSKTSTETESLGRQSGTKNLLLNKNDSLHKFRKPTGNKEYKNNTAKGRRMLKINMAKERLDKLKKTLNMQIEDQRVNNRLLENCDKSLLEIMSNNDEPLDIYKTADIRHKNLRNRLLRNKKIVQVNEMLLTVKSNAQSTNDQSKNSLEDPLLESNISVCEEMDWEPMEYEKITFEVQAARTQLCINNIEHQKLPMAENILRIPSSTIQEEKKTLYIVIDTNVFLSNIEAIKKARDIQFGTYNRPILVIPWTVIRELDYIKDDKSRVRSKNLSAKARRAIHFLNEHFSAKHPRLVGQTPEDVANNKERFAIECPDDEILQTCLQIRDAGRTVALLSYDKNLCNKAMIYDVIALGRDDPLEKIDYLSSSNNMNSSFHDNYYQKMEGRESEIISIFQEELHFSHELFEDIQSTVKECLSVIVSKEMKNLYGDTWEKYTILRPPWTIVDVLKCAVKHWIAAVSEAFDRRAEPILKELLEIFSKMPTSGSKLKDIAYLLEKCSDLTQMIKVDKYPDLMIRASNAVDELRKKCQIFVNEIREKRLQDEIGKEDDVMKQKHRAEKAFKYFENIYAYARDIGGMAANIMGMPCSFCYQVPTPAPSVEYVKKFEPEVAENVCRLLSVLSTALEQIQNSCVDHQAVIDLYHILTNFLPETLPITTCDFSPLDVYCCLKQKEDVLRTGMQQLQELSTHFCRLASYKCT